MWRRFITVLLMLLTTGSVFAKDNDTSHNPRELVHRIAPTYPDLARRLQISGIVKLQPTVAPNGSVKSIEPWAEIRYC